MLTRPSTPHIARGLLGKCVGPWRRLVLCGLAGVATGCSATSAGAPDASTATPSGSNGGPERRADAEASSTPLASTPPEKVVRAPATGVGAADASLTAAPESPSLSPAEQLRRARAAAQTFAREKAFSPERIAKLAEAPLGEPVTIKRDGRDVTTFRWLGHGRGDDYVQAEVAASDGSVVVYGGFAHREFGPFRPGVDLGLTLFIGTWPEGTWPEDREGQLHLRVAVRNVTDSALPHERVMMVLSSGTLYARGPAGETIERSLGLWRGPVQPDLPPGELGNHCLNGLISSFLGSEAPGRYVVHWESSGLRSNDLLVERDAQGRFRVVPAQ